MFQILVGVVGAGNVRHHREHCKRRQQVRQKVEINRAHGGRFAIRSNDSNQQITGMRHTGEAHQALDVALGKRGKIAEKNGRHRHRRKHGNQHRLQRPENIQRQDHQHSESSRLGTDG